MKNHNRVNKCQPLVQEVELLEFNPEYAHVRFTDNRETSFNVRYMAPKELSTSQVPEINCDPLERPLPEHSFPYAPSLPVQSTNPDSINPLLIPRPRPMMGHLRRRTGSTGPDLK